MYVVEIKGNAGGVAKAIIIREEESLLGNPELASLVSAARRIARGVKERKRGGELTVDGLCTQL